jgi:hypothetical protein
MVVSSIGMLSERYNVLKRDHKLRGTNAAASEKGVDDSRRSCCP